MRFLSAAFIGCAALSSVVVLSQGCSGATPTSGFGPGDSGVVPGEDGGTGADVQIEDAPSFGDGFSRDTGLSADASCATATAKAARQGVYMLIVLDGSGSMSQNNKWTAVVPALDAFFDDLKTKNDPSFAVGLTVFSDSNDPATCNPFTGACTYNAIQVPIRAVDAAQASALRGRIDPSGPSGGTPTFSVLSGQFPLLEAYSASAPVPPGGKKVLVLMTDGVPNGGASEQNQCVTTTKAEFAKAPPQQITTFAVGIGNFSPLDTANYDPAFMGRLAVAGGAPNAGCDPTNVTDPTKMCHFQITPGSKTAQQLEADFLAAINAIRGQVASCEFLLEKPDGGGQIDPGKVNVEYDDGNGNKVVIPPDPVNGWTYDDPATPTKVILHGTSCAAMKANVKGSINVILGCKTIQPH